MEAQLDEHRKIVEGMDTENRRLRETVVIIFANLELREFLGHNCNPGAA